MNSTLKSVLIFFGGCAAGAGGMWLGLRSYYQHKADDEIASMMDYVDKTYRKDSKNNEEVRELVPKIVKLKHNEETNAEKNMLNSYKESVANEENRTNYSKAYAPGKENGTVYEPSGEAPNEDEERSPYIITEEEYALPEPYNDVITLIYDKRHHALINYSTEELIVEPAELIGIPALEALGNMKDKSYLYVRDDKNSTDYEIEVREIEDYDDEAAT